MHTYKEVWDEDNFKFKGAKVLKNVDWATKDYNTKGIYRLQWGEMLAGVLFVLSLLCLVSLPAWVSYLV